MTTHRSQSDALNTVAEVAGYLANRLAAGGADIDVRPLGGGVSNGVFAVSVAGSRWVLKQSLPRLRVADEWYADRGRIVSEADALRLAGEITPGAVPAVVDVDDNAFTLTIERAPDGWRDWKTRLLAGHAETWVARRLGELLAGWHAATVDGARLGPRLRDNTAFEQLRVDPYYRTVMLRRPELAAAVGGYVDAMADRACCLVHGDFSPKNVLVGDGELWVVDFEVAHYGDPAFDLAFLLSHLLLKSIFRPAAAADYYECARAFADAYGDVAVRRLRPDWPYVLGHTGCLLLARADGKSPAEYLTDVGRDRARELGRWLVTAPPPTLEQAYGQFAVVMSA